MDVNTLDCRVGTTRICGASDGDDVKLGLWVLVGVAEAGPVDAVPGEGASVVTAEVEVRGEPNDREALLVTVAEADVRPGELEAL